MWKLEKKRDEIAQMVPCSLNAVNQWIKHYRETRDVEDKPRPGRPRKIDENTEPAIIAAWKEKPIQRGYQYGLASLGMA